jgi:hypothetical protein
MAAPRVIDTANLRVGSSSIFTKPGADQPVVQILVDEFSEEGLAATIETNIGGEMPITDVQAATAHLLHRLAHVVASDEFLDLKALTAGGAS